ncbi:hypothetical protein ASE14_01800 [Agromyces sp. Root81]|nr:hypothetical protein ASE14_01800 [Agromyces sp. Root81]
MITVRGGDLTATIDPARGAKICSLLGADGTEWLSQGDPERAAGRGRVFVDAEMRGWDECAPSIVGCRIDGRNVPDHGDLWDREFEVADDTVRAIGDSLGYRFERRIRPTIAGLRLEYRATALERRMPFLWAAHPQFDAPAGTRVEVPASVARVVDVLDPATPTVDWDPLLATIDSVAAGGCRKLYADPGFPVNEARLVRPDGAELGMRWSAACPYLGLWFDAGAYSPVPVIAIEPSTGYFDSLETAVRMDRVPVLDKGDSLAWWVDLEPIGYALRHA